ncbi:MAG TPA: prepilin-type N-terminal cleavage/methylation domain-containing protein [Solirubrobacteraceae bacterium]|nr:prepilin-type N-terminal cleavage/methylation domain-containing protein [Solirubrobacteraceae bacterium]
MLSRTPTPGRPRWAEERGFTLIEMLVAMVVGVVITAALLAILEFSLRQESRITDRVAADRTGRTALTTVIEELRSGCTGLGSAAIQAPSSTPTSPLAALGGSNLWFLSAYGNSTSGAAAISAVTLHDVNWAATGTSNTGAQVGTLTDYSFAGSGESPSWKFPSLSTTNATAKVLAKNVTPLETGTLFHYYRYNTTTGALVEVASNELASMATNKKVAKVTIAYNQAPEPITGRTPDTREGHTTSFSSAVVLRFTPPESGEGWSCT